MSLTKFVTELERADRLASGNRPAGGTAAEKAEYGKQAGKVRYLLERSQTTATNASGLERKLAACVAELSTVATTQALPAGFRDRLVEARDGVKEAVWLSEAAWASLNELLRGLSDNPVRRVFDGLSAAKREELLILSIRLNQSKNEFAVARLDVLLGQINENLPYIDAGITSLDRAINDLNDLKLALGILTSVVGLFTNALKIFVP